jgi:dipeptidyl aminopeptidase/acylaminoacyl peptidase
MILDVHGGPVWAFADFWLGTFRGFFLVRGYALLQPNLVAHGAAGEISRSGSSATWAARTR